MTDEQGVLPEGTQRMQGATAQQRNIFVAQLIAGIVKTTLGPKGMDKLLVDGLGDVTVTNDGVTILREMTIENPVAKMMVEIAKTQEAEVGDGTTTAVVLAGELLKNAQELINKNVHPTVICKGFKLAADEAIRELNKMGVKIDISDRKTFVQIAKTAMTGKGAEDHKEQLAEIVVDCILKVTKQEDLYNFVDVSDINVEPRTGGSVSDTEIIEGIVLDKNRAHPNMPRIVENAAILLMDTGIEIKTMDADTQINITDPEQMQKFMRNEAEMIKTMIDKIGETKANVVMCSRNIDDSAVHFLAKAGIFAVKRVSRDLLEKISKATGARVVTNIDEVSSEDSGFAGIVEEKFVGDTDLVFIRECKDAESVTVLVRGSTEQVTAEVKRALEDALGDIASMIMDGKAVGGAGAPEIMLSEKIRAFASTQTGRIQLAIEAFAKSFEVIPQTIAENAGLDPIDILAELKSTLHAEDVVCEWPGINVETGKTLDAWNHGIIEPLKVKTQAVRSAAEVAVMVLRIDDVIAIMTNPNAPPAGYQP